MFTGGTPTAPAWQEFILKEVGAGLDGLGDYQKKFLDYITPQIGLLWNAWADKAYFPRLQYLYVKRHCLDILLGGLRLSVDKSLGPLQQSLSQRVAHLERLREFVSDDIKITEGMARANRTPVVANTNVRAVIEPTPPRQIQLIWNPDADPNDPKYRGSPF